MLRDGARAESARTPQVAAAPRVAARVSALGRLEPHDGVIRVAGPSDAVAVVAELKVAQGDPVEAGQVIAILDDMQIRAAELERARAQFANAEREYERQLELHEENVIADAQRDGWALKLRVAQAELRNFEAAYEQSRVRSPITGQVLEVHTRDGERVGPDGIVELGKTREMYAIAEVYETDIGRVTLGQRARVTSPALREPLFGTVDRIGLKVGKADELGTDPAAKADARVIEVEVRLDDSEPAASLTHLQVAVELGIER